MNGMEVMYEGEERMSVELQRKTARCREKCREIEALLKEKNT